MPLDSSLGGFNQPAPVILLTFSSIVLANSPYAWYRCNEASGSTLVDSSGNGNNGLIIGTPTYRNAGFSVDGNHSLGIPTNGAASLQLLAGPGSTGGAFTVGMW